MTQEDQKLALKLAKDSLKKEKIREWQASFAEYLDKSNQLSDENGSVLDQWRAF